MRSVLLSRNASWLKHLKHTPACDNQLILGVFRGIFLMARKQVLRVRHGVIFKQGGIPVHAEPMHVHCASSSGLLRLHYLQIGFLCGYQSVVFVLTREVPVTDQYIEVSLPGFEGIVEEATTRPLRAFPRHAGGSQCFIKSLWVENMKGFEGLEIEFSDFNVLVGPNNCGKTTILQAIDLCFRLIQYHAEFQKNVLVTPRQGRRIIDEMLPVAESVDFWFHRRYRVGNTRVPVVIGAELEGGYRFEFEIKRLWGGLNSRMTQLPEGVSQETITEILARRPTLIPSSFGVVKREEFHTPARIEILALTGQHNEILRNHLRDLWAKFPEVYRGLQDDLRTHFGGTIGSVEFSFEEDQYISVNYEESGFEHDVFSAGGGFLQILQVLTYLYLQTPGIVLLDEPDSHLHSSLQRLVVDLLGTLNRREKLQIIMATHSKEIINYVDASHILPISRSLKQARPLEHHSSVVPILQDLGAIDNADLANLVASRRCVFVEGSLDKTLLPRFAARLSSTVFEGQTQVVLIPMKGVDHPEKYVGLDIFESVVGKPIKAVIIRDRDGLPDDLVQEICDHVSGRGRDVVVLDRTHIENYLLLPKVIWRVICNKLRQKGTKEADLPSSAQIAAGIEKIIDDLYLRTFDSIATQIGKHWATYHSQHLATATLNARAREFLDSRWQTQEQKLAIVLGKQALKSIRRDIQEAWGVSFTNNSLVEAMTEDEIPTMIKQIIGKLETL